MMMLGRILLFLSHFQILEILNTKTRLRILKLKERKEILSTEIILRTSSAICYGRKNTKKRKIVLYCFKKIEITIN
jgi:hypothetical protein